MSCCQRKNVRVHHGKKNLKELFKKHKGGISLDVGCGSSPQKGFVGLDIRPLPTVDIVHDAERTPYPLPKESCKIILCSHLIEHLCPKNFVGVMDEWWRLLKVGGQLWAALPYATSFGFYQDPTHCNHVNEATWDYFSPFKPLYRIYRPRPWKIIKSVYYHQGNMEVVLEKMDAKEALRVKTPELQ